MKYPEEFIQRVKNAFPNWKDMHQHLDSGSAVVGFYLNNNLPDSTTLGLAKLVLDPEKRDEAIRVATRIKEISDIYKQYNEISKNQ